MRLRKECGRGVIAKLLDFLIAACPGRTESYVWGKRKKNMLNAQAGLGFAFSYPGNSEDDRFRPAVLSKIARFLWESKPGLQPESEQFRSAIPWRQGHHEVEKSILLSLSGPLN